MPGRTFAVTAFACLFLAAPAAGMGDPGVAALQVALRARAVYGGPIDGLKGPQTTAAVVAFQRRAGLVPDGIAGRATRAALGRRGRPALGRRLLSVGKRGWDVAALQYLLAWHGFPSGSIDGDLGPRTEAAVLRFQRWSRLGADGVAGPGTIRALRTPPRRSPARLRSPVGVAPTDGFGVRGDRFHAGLDYPADTGTPVRAARGGRVTRAGWDPTGYGNLVVVRHGRVRTLYAHLSAIAVRKGQRVSTGALLGRVGSTGNSTGPHLHFEVRLRGAALDPLTALR